MQFSANPGKQWTSTTLLLVALAVIGLLALRGSRRPGQLSAPEAQERRAEVATVDTQRQDWITHQQRRKDDLQRQAEAAQMELIAQRDAAGTSDEATRSQFDRKVAQYNELLEQIRLVDTGLRNVYYVTPVPAKSARRLPAEKEALPYADEDLVEIEAEPIVVRNRLSDRVDPLFAAHKFAELEALAGELRRTKAECADGTSHLRIFYNGLAMMPDYLPESAWTDRVATLRNWIAQFPESVTPRIALASVWTEWAWRARGGEVGRKVSPEASKLFQDRLDEAGKVLVEARKLSEKCPISWDLAQRIALGQQWDRKRYDRLFDEAIASDPHFTGFYANRVRYLLPRWFGKPGEYNYFMEIAADQLGGEEGDVLYARLIWQLQTAGMFQTNGIVQEAKLSWPRLRRGLEGIVRRYPDSIAAASELCALSGQQREYERMRPLFAQIGPYIDTSVFGERRFFLQDRQAAFR